MPRIILSSDSTCDLSSELKIKLDVHNIPMIVNLENNQYYDGVNIKPQFIYKSVERCGKLPKTSAISVYEYINYFNSLKKNADDIILHFSISNEFSSTFQNSLLASNEVKNVYCINSRNLSTGIGLQIIKARKLIDEGKDIEEIVEILNDYTNYIDASFVIDKLDYLAKGGRCSLLTSFLASSINLKPCIEVINGKMIVGKKYRGRFDRVLLKYISERLNDDYIVRDDVFITHAGVDKEIVDLVYNKVKETRVFKNIYVTEAGCTISSHCGRNTLGILYVRKNHK